MLRTRRNPTYPLPQRALLLLLCADSVPPPYPPHCVSFDDPCRRGLRLAERVELLSESSILHLEGLNLLLLLRQLGAERGRRVDPYRGLAAINTSQHTQLKGGRGGQGGQDDREEGWGRRYEHIT